MKKNYIAVDQYGTLYRQLGHFPRKELLRRLCRKKARNIYRDSKDGVAIHVGYLIAGLWLEVYEVTPFKNSMGVKQ